MFCDSMTEQITESGVKEITCPKCMKEIALRGSNNHIKYCKGKEQIVEKPEQKTEPIEHIKERIQKAAEIRPVEPVPEEASQPDEEPEPEDEPKQGQPIAIFIVIFIVGMMAVIGIMFKDEIIERIKAFREGMKK